MKFDRFREIQTQHSLDKMKPRKSRYPVDAMNDLIAEITGLRSAIYDVVRESSDLATKRKLVEILESWHLMDD